MLDKDVDDYAKELAVRGAALVLLRASFVLLIKLSAVLFFAALPIVVADSFGLASAQDIMLVLLDIRFLTFATIISIVTAYAVSAFRRSTATDKRVLGYSPTEQFLHSLAFSNFGIQKSAAWLENIFMGDRERDLASPPIFVTSIARGGTTALLNALSNVPSVATHLYRDMPFLLAPRLWDKIWAVPDGR